MAGAPYVMEAVPVNDAPAIVPTVDNTRLTIEETMKYLRWTESDYVTARDASAFRRVMRGARPLPIFYPFQGMVFLSSSLRWSQRDGITAEQQDSREERNDGISREAVVSRDKHYSESERCQTLPHSLHSNHRNVGPLTGGCSSVCSFDRHWGQIDSGSSFDIGES